MSLNLKAINSVKWSILAEVTAKTISPLVFVILARFLAPEDFGVMAAATVIISFSQVFWDAGLAKALIQRQDCIEESAEVVFWVNLALGSLLFLILFAGADLVGAFFHDERIAVVVRVLSLQSPLAALASVHTAMLQREFNFKRLFKVRLLTSVAPTLVSVPMALNGLGYWALVGGTLMGQAAQTVMLWNIAVWRPSFTFNRRLAFELFSFGRWAMLSALLGWFFNWMDSIIVGRFLGTYDLGLYRTGNALVSVIFGLVFAPLLPVLYSMFSRIQYDMDRIRKTAFFTGKLMAVILFPVGFGLVVVRDQIPALVFGGGWFGVGDVVSVIAVTQAVAYTVSINQEIYRGIGRPDLEAKIMIISMMIRLPSYLISINYGLMYFVFARFASTVLGLVNHLMFAKAVIKIPYRDYFNIILIPLSSGLIMLWAGLAFDSELGPGFSPLFRTLLVIAFCSIFYTALIFILDRKFIVRAYNVLRSPR